MKNGTTFKYTIYNTLLLIFSSVFISNHILITKYPKISFLIPFFILIIVLFFYFFLPKMSNSKYFNKIVNQPIIKTILMIYLYGSTMTFLVASISTVTTIFYSSMPYVQCGIILLLMILFFSCFSLNQLYDLSLLIFIFCFLFNFIGLKNTTNICFFLPANLSFEFKKPYLFLSLIYLQLDSIIFYFFNITKDSINIKKSIIISTIISTCISSLLIFNNYLFYTYKYFSSAFFPGFSASLLYLGPEFLEHFDILILISLITWILLKGSTNLRLLFDLRKAKKNNFFQVILGLIVLVNIYLIYRFNINWINYVIVSGYILSLLIFIIFGYLVYLKGETNHVITKTISRS